MGLFDKKYCDICGEKIGLLGNRKLEDGNLCKNCAAKLSPFFSERRRSTVEDIKRQLAYREENEKLVGNFNPDVMFDGSKKVYISTVSEAFIVTGSSNWRSANPDIIKLSQVVAVDTNIKENREEIFFEDSDGNRKSYDPPRYAYDYEFNVTIRVDSPWFDEIELELSDGNRPDSPYTDLYRQYEQRMHELADILMRRDNRNRVWDGGSTMNRVDSTGIRQERPATAPTVMGGETWVCPSCGAQSSGKFCANCGAVKPVARSCCSNCGWRPANGQSLPKFCPECGRPLQ